MMEQPIKVTEWQQTYTYDSGIHSGVNTQVPSVSSKCLGDDDEVYGKQYTIKKTTTTSYCQGGNQSQSQAQGRGCRAGMSAGSAALLLPSSSSSPTSRAPSGRSSTPRELLLPKVRSILSSFPMPRGSCVGVARSQPAPVLSRAHTSQHAGGLARGRNS